MFDCDRVKPCGGCPACLDEKALLECDRVVYARWEESMGQVWAILCDRSVPPPLPTRVLEKMRTPRSAGR